LKKYAILSFFIKFLESNQGFYLFIKIEVMNKDDLLC